MDSPRVDSTISVEPHPRLRPVAFGTRFPGKLGDHPTPPAIVELLDRTAEAPFRRDEAVRAAVRDALRHGGYRPTGRGKPASEYLVRAAENDGLRSINLAVDACNAVSLHSGLPISVVDLDSASPPFRIATARPGERYVFNPAGQEIDLEGLVCLFDSEGPCGNAIKDAQRTKTHSDTTRTLSVIWGCIPHKPRTHAAAAWYRSLLESAGAETYDVDIAGGGTGDQ